MMKIVFVAPINSIHVVRWANAIVNKVEQLSIITLHDKNHFHNIDSKVRIYRLKFNAPLGYITNIFQIQRFIREICPDLIHVHQCSGHGTLMALTNIKAYLLSIYGADIYTFPKRNFITSSIIRRNLARAEHLASTSYIMAHEAKKYTHKEIFITPFGVDLQKFYSRRTPFQDPQNIHIGLVKSLRKKYGIEYLLKSIPLLLDKLERNGIDKQLKFTIYGQGDLKEHLEHLAEKLNLKNVFFPGYISNDSVGEILNDFDIVCLPSISNSESFGVSAVESMACERPVIVSDVDGFKEVVENEKSGIIVPKKDPEAIAQAIFSLISDVDFARKLGINGRRRVNELYNWDDNVSQMLNIYDEIIQSPKKSTT